MLKTKAITTTAPMSAKSPYIVPPASGRRVPAAGPARCLTTCALPMLLRRSLDRTGPPASWLASTQRPPRLEAGTP